MKKKYIVIIIISILIIFTIGGFFAFNYFKSRDEVIEIPEEDDIEMLFNDVPISNEASTAIDFLVQRDIMSVSGDEKFYPDNKVTNGEFIKILAKASLSSANYKDISGDDYLKYAELLEKNNVLKVSEINIDDLITKKDVAILLAKADLKIKNQNQVFTNVNFSDLKGVDEIGQTLIGHSVERGFILLNNERTFNPNINMTRADIANIIYLFINS